MYKNLLILGLILFIVFCIISKKRFLQSLFFTIYFIFVLWINMPCFCDLPLLGTNNDFFMIPFILNEKFNISYIIFANVILGLLLLWQSKLTNKEKYTYNEIKKIYDEFGSDAIELYVIGRDLDFLYGKGFEKQTERIIHLRDKCSLLCEETADESLLELYEKVSEYGVKIKFYTQNDNITNLKGQIKMDQNGIKKAVFTSKKDKGFIVLNIDNQFLVSTILEQCNKIYGSQKKF